MRAAPLSAAVLGALLGAACGGQAPAGTPVTFLDYTTELPSTWAPREASSSMRLGEYVAPAGADSVQVVVYYFGQGQGGSAQANIGRWTSQFSAPGGGPVEPSVERLGGTEFPTTLVTLEGNYTRTIGMGSQGMEPLEDHRLEAAVVETPRGNLYVQMFGPVEAVRERSQEFLGFVRGMGPGS